MTGSRVENLLRQMSLKKPSDNLDDRVNDVLRCSDAVMLRSSSSVPGWKQMLAVAVVCLFVGLMVGRLTAPDVVAGERTSVATGLDGPRVAILCSMSERTVSGSEANRCSKCHSGSGVVSEDYRVSHCLDPFLKSRRKRVSHLT